MGSLVVFFLFHSILIEHSVSKQDPNQLPCSASSDMGLHCLPMSHQKDAWLICINPPPINIFCPENFVCILCLLHILKFT